MNLSDKLTTIGGVMMGIGVIIALAGTLSLVAGFLIEFLKGGLK